MFRLNVLGQINLRDDAGGELRPVLAQPKRLASATGGILQGTVRACERSTVNDWFIREFRVVRAGRKVKGQD